MPESLGNPFRYAAEAADHFRQQRDEAREEAEMMRRIIYESLRDGYYPSPRDWWPFPWEGDPRDGVVGPQDTGTGFPESGFRNRTTDS